MSEVHSELLRPGASSRQPSGYSIHPQVYLSDQRNRLLVRIVAQRAKILVMVDSDSFD